MNNISSRVRPIPTINKDNNNPTPKISVIGSDEDSLGCSFTASPTINVTLHYQPVDLQDELVILYKWMMYFGIGCPVRLLRNARLHLHRIYSTVVLFLLWSNFLRGAIGMRYVHRDDFVAQAVSTAWFLQCALKATIWFCRDIKPSAIEDFFRHWNTLCQSQVSLQYGLGINQLKLRRSVRLIIAAIIFLCIINTSIIFFARVGPIEATRNDTTYYYVPLPSDSQIPLMALIPFKTAVYFLPVAEFVLISKVLTRQFINLRIVLTECLKKKGSSMELSLEHIRVEHQHLAHAVYKADQTFSLYLAIEYSTTIAILTFLLYQLLIIHNQFSPFGYIMLVIWASAVALVISTISWFAAVMHEQAHEMIHYIHSATVPSEPTGKYIMEMNMLLAKLNGASIAFSVYTLLPITKAFILTIVGVMVTYFAIAAQSVEFIVETYT